MCSLINNDPDLSSCELLTFSQNTTHDHKLLHHDETAGVHFVKERNNNALTSILIYISGILEINSRGTILKYPLFSPQFERKRLPSLRVHIDLYTVLIPRIVFILSGGMGQALLVGVEEHVFDFFFFNFFSTSSSC